MSAANGGTPNVKSRAIPCQAAYKNGGETMSSFKPIIGFPDYTINEYGTIISYRRKNPVLIIGKVSHRGYHIVGLRDTYSVRKHLSVHRLVASTFIPNPLGLPDVNHVDGNKLNNHVSNLEWCDKSGNARHAIDVLNKWPRLSPISVVIDSGERFAFNKKMEGVRFIADREGLSFDHVRKLISGQRKDVSGLLRGYKIKKIGGRCNDYPTAE